jgi:hypothetical protein
MALTARNLQYAISLMSSDSDPLEPQTHDGGSPVRVINTDEAEWRVYEQASVYDRRRRPDLVFESDGVIRRVRNYPETWMELSDAALLAVSWSR